MRHSELPKLLREREAADILGISDYWLQKARYLGNGPRYIRVGGQSGRAIRYLRADLEQYLAENAVETTDSRRASK